MLKDYYWYWLCNIKGIGIKKRRQLLDVFNEPECIYKTDEKLLSEVKQLSEKDVMNIILSKNDRSIYDDFISLGNKGIKLTYPGKNDYPERLMNIYDYPHLIYYKGTLPSGNLPSVSIVGSRQNTSYGRSVASYLAESYGRMGIQVISGLALGIDTSAHKGAVKGGGYTCGVLGCGIDICYPRENIELYTYMCEHGCVMSEYPPGTTPFSGQFPMRNRIISGLSDVVIVVEARKKSGSLITADQALEQNRDVYAVPGRIGDSLSEGCNELIKMGAGIITKAEDIFDNERVRILIPKSPKTGIGTAQKDDNLINQEEKNRDFGVATKKDMLYSSLNLYPMSLNTLIEKTKLSLGEVSEILVQLELEGLVSEVSRNCYARVYQ